MNIFLKSEIESKKTCQKDRGIQLESIKRLTSKRLNCIVKHPVVYIVLNFIFLNK